MERGPSCVAKAGNAALSFHKWKSFINLYQQSLSLWVRHDVCEAGLK
jgi:hypothetical protein